jgi:hypothetical protein
MSSSVEDAPKLAATDDLDESELHQSNFMFIVTCQSRGTDVAYADQERSNGSRAARAYCALARPRSLRYVTRS